MSLAPGVWRKCSSCKKDINLGAKYYECSVSTCTGQRTGYVFCSIPCWEVHLPGARHRDAGAVERTAPKNVVAASDSPVSMSNPVSNSSSVQGNSADGVGSKSSSGPVRRIISANSNPASASTSVSVKSPMQNEVLVVVSKMKQYIRDVSEMNTSEEVSHILSQLIREACDQAIQNARNDGRKTVMARDFKK